MWKKATALTAAALMLGSSLALAAPVHQMAKHETAIEAGTKESSIEHKVTDKATAGFAYNDRDEYGDQKDVYLQYDIIGSEIKAIGGYRWNLPGDHSRNMFGGVAVSTPKIMGFDAYASYISGRDFNEAQFGVNKDIIANVGLNVNYHNFKPDDGHHESGVGAGVTVKF